MKKVKEIVITIGGNIYSFKEGKSGVVSIGYIRQSGQYTGIVYYKKEYFIFPNPDYIRCEREDNE